MGLLLYLLSLVLSAVLLPVGFVYGVFAAFWRHRWRTGVKTADAKFLELAKSIDKYGNVACAELLNAALIKKDSPHRFGRIEETISKVVGLNLLSGHLTYTGRALNRLLNRIDPGHTLDAVRDR
jgi:8-oxo-dGTP diphosphatase